MKTLAQAREEIARDAWANCRLQLRMFIVAGIRPPMPLKVANRKFEELTQYQRAAIAHSAHRLVESAGQLTALVDTG